MDKVFVTDIPFSDLKIGHRLRGVNGVFGTIRGTEVSRDEHVGEEKDNQIVLIIWSKDLAEPKGYPYEILSRVQVVGEPSTDLGNMVLTSVEYDESDRTVSDTVFDVGVKFSIECSLLDVNLTDDGYLSVMSHDVVIVADFAEDVIDTVDNDIFNYIDETISVEFIVTDFHILEITGVTLP